ncbi:lysostaphin resistance A-like protein [Pseudalkalibacillus sp. Hm43]|uniref:CPBP family intramembrane glutamic endopeptidase n=1 Tax=Pseudalkalibacillus sp. Hm43 TaxID=3450742 RepID=UPI003F44091D
MLNRESYFREVPWSWRHFVSLMLIVLVLVPYFVEYHLKNYVNENFQNELYSGTFIGLVMAFIFLISLYFVAIRPLQLTWVDVGVRSFPKGYWRSIIGWTLAVILLSIIIVIIMDLLIHVGTENSKTESLQSQLNIVTFLIGFISAAIVSPIYEEIFYRGFVYRFLRYKYGIPAGLIISSTIFMIVHIPTYNTLPINLVTGLVFAWTYEKTGSIWPGVIIHGTFNGIAIVLTAISS